MLGWDRYRFNKKHVGTCYAELLFFHPLRSAGHVVHSVAPGHETSTHYCSCWWDRFGFNKKRAETRYAELVILYSMGTAGHVVHSGAFGVRNVDALFFMLGGPDAVSIKTCRETLRRTCVFSSGGISGSRIAFRCVRGMKRRHAIFHARVRLVQIQQKAR
jgi:hypothetical protein